MQWELSREALGLQASAICYKSATEPPIAPSLTMDVRCKQITDSYDKHWRSAVVAWMRLVPRPCKWNAVSFLSSYVVRSSWQTTPCGLTILRSIAIKNEFVKTKYFISDGRKTKSQARLEKSKWRNEARPPHTRKSSPPPGRPPRRYRRGNSHNSSLETEETDDRHLESLLHSRQPSEDAGSKRDGGGSPGKSRLLHGRLEDYGQQGRNRDIYPEEKREHKTLEALKDCNHLTEILIKLLP